MTGRGYGLRNRSPGADPILVAVPWLIRSEPEGTALWIPNSGFQIRKPSVDRGSYPFGILYSIWNRSSHSPRGWNSMPMSPRRAPDRGAGSGSTLDIGPGSTAPPTGADSAPGATAAAPGPVAGIDAGIKPGTAPGEVVKELGS